MHIEINTLIELNVYDIGAKKGEINFTGVEYRRGMPQETLKWEKAVSGS